MNTFFQIFAIILAGTCALFSIPLLRQLSWPAPVPWIIKLVSSALSPIQAMIGMFALATGITTGSFFVTVLGTYVFLVYSLHIYKVTRPPADSTGYRQAFGPDWEEKINPSDFLTSRFGLKLPARPGPRFSQNVVFATVPGTERKLLCDIWQPPTGVTPSGLAFIYLHGAAWYMLDKDLGTRPFFKHLAAQGHLVMDVANRLAPETDMMGMIHDAKRGIAWIKDNAVYYSVNPKLIAIGGASSGSHLAMMAAYTAGNLQFVPAELYSKNLEVCSVVSYYGQANLEAFYYHTNQHLTTRPTPGGKKIKVPAKMPSFIVKSMGDDYHRLGLDKSFEKAGTLSDLFGCHPDECPGKYELFSPASHVHPGCPPTLLIHGMDDLMAPVNAMINLFALLQKAKVPSVLHLLPQTDHAFDLFLPRLSPATHNAIYDVERFLALQVNMHKKTSMKETVERHLLHS